MHIDSLSSEEGQDAGDSDEDESSSEDDEEEEEDPSASCGLSKADSADLRWLAIVFCVLYYRASERLATIPPGDTQHTPMRQITQSDSNEAHNLKLVQAR